MPLTHAYVSELRRLYPPLAPPGPGHGEKAGPDVSAAGTDRRPGTPPNPGAIHSGPDDGQ